MLATRTITIPRMRNAEAAKKPYPSQRRLLLQHLLLPLIPSLGFATVPVFLQGKKRLAFLRDYFPDLAWITILGGIFAGIWACLRAVLLVRELHKPGSPSVLKR
ncbi:MAG TPA: hypothetical protein VHO48_13230 [Anaerolineaceae bacterium]|nr:hypothetical protein [Anaerolineaceae bacterium]